MEKRASGGERLTNEDLLTEVLSRLRVKCLLCCKAVSKTWLSLISSPSFIKSHLHRAAAKKDDDILIGKITRFEEDDDFQQVDGSFSLINFRYREYVAHLIFPYSKGDYNFYPDSRLVGSDCGIVCVSVDVSRVLPDHKTPDVYLWNPATKRSKLIPPHTIHVDDFRERVAVGVGFDLVDFDFKVVRVVYLIPAERQYLNENAYVVVYSSNKDELKSAIKNASAEVYSAKRNTWKNIEGQLTDVPRRHCFDLCLRGFLFAKGYYGMMVFDLNEEVFICDIKLPISSDGSSTRIVDYKDSIAVIIYKFRGSDHKINLWTLDNEACLRGGDGGVKASWTLMLSIDIGETFDFVRGLFNSVEYLLLITNETVAGEWFSYNSVKKVGNFIYIYPFFDFGDVFKYTESLLSIPGSKLIDWPADEDENGGNSADSEDDSQDGNDESSFVSDDDNEERNAYSKVKEESSTGSEYDNEESSPDSGGEL